MTEKAPTIILKPYCGDGGSEVFALVESLGMNVYFDDVDCRTCRFCFKADREAPIVDYDVGFDMLDEWFEGKRELMLEPLPHDPNRFSDDLTFEE